MSLKNRFRAPGLSGYRDALALVRVVHGAGEFVCELQCHLAPLREFDETHRCGPRGCQ